MTAVFLIGSAVLGVGMVAGGYALGGYPLLGLLLAALGAIWLFGLIRRWKWIPLLGLVSVYGFAAAGFFLRLSGVLLFVGALLGLLSWDLTDFSARLRLAADQDDVPALERRHFLQLVLVFLPGAVLSAAALLLRVQISFGWAVVLILFGVWGFGRMVNQLLH